MSERRINKSGLNFTQRVFDALDADKGSTIAELQHRTRLPYESIITCIKRLQAQRTLQPAMCVDGAWLYRKRKDAQRPIDRRYRQSEAA